MKDDTATRAGALAFCDIAARATVPCDHCLRATRHEFSHFREAAEVTYELDEQGMYRPVGVRTEYDADLGRRRARTIYQMIYVCRCGQERVYGFIAPEAHEVLLAELRDTKYAGLVPLLGVHLLTDARAAN